MDAAEFDRFADEYDLMHEKKIKVLVRLAQQRNLKPESILDFGSGIGNSTPFFRRDFPAQLASADVSLRCLDIAESRFAGHGNRLTN